MRVILTGGGTAGHISPALSIADYIKEKEPQSEFLYIGNMDKMESKIVPEAGYNFVGLKTTGMSRKLSFKGIKQNITALFQNNTEKKKVKQIIEKFKPDVVIATAGYVSAPTISVAVKLGIPTFIHESNGYPGLVTKMFASKVTCVLLGDKSIKKHIKETAVTRTVGTPVSKKILIADREKSRIKLNIKDEDFVIFSFGGSLGAKTINQKMAYVMGQLKEDKNIIFIHSMGSLYLNYFKEYLKENGINDEKDYKNLKIYEYINNMDECLSAADLIISRAGINTVNEIGVSGVASILIPSPNVTENHQYYNAMILGSKEAAVVIEEKNLTNQLLLETIKNLINDKEKNKKMGKIAKETIKTDANKHIYKVIKELM